MPLPTTPASSRLLAGALAAPLLIGALAGCTDNRAGSGSGAVAVTATDTECTLSSVEAPSGTVTFTVTNKGSKVNEFYLLASDGLRIIGEIENIGPGLTRDLVLAAQPGSYLSACKPGMVGDGIRADFTVTDSGQSASSDPDTDKLVATANQQYSLYVKDQTDQLLAGTKAFVTAFNAGDEKTARELYAATRLH
ncbi:cupredoxin domain-containing protein [Aestuariimicrobium soli]|uniref:cupredoxin domain-containing protein n=1 Tax=Aestuariimicrobium soli TaxID=2035834 RepID=UPI003EBCFE5C